MRKRFRRILVVDDDLHGRTLADESRSIYTAPNCVSAVELARRMAPDLVLLDLRRARDALSVLAELTQVHPALTVVIVNASLSLREILANLESEQESPLELETTPSLARAEWEYIVRVMRDCDRKVSVAAERLGIHRSTLQRKLKKNPSPW